MRRMHKLIAALVLVLALSAGASTVAFAWVDNMQPDQDGRSHEYFYSGSLDGNVGVTRGQYDSNGGYASYGAGRFYYHGSGTIASHAAGQWWFRYWDNRTGYDSNEMRYYGAGSYDWGVLLRHERAHQRGLDHFQGTPSTNPAYYPQFTYCHC